MATPPKVLPLQPTKAPNLPIAPVDYSQQIMDQLLNAFRLYFAQIDNDVYGLINNPGSATVVALLNGSTGTITYNTLNANALVKTGTGTYTLSFINSLISDNYVPQITLGALGYAVVSSPTISSVGIKTYNSSGTLTDFSYIAVTIFGGGVV